MINANKNLTLRKYLRYVAIVEDVQRDFKRIFDTPLGLTIAIIESPLAHFWRKNMLRTLYKFYQLSSFLIKKKTRSLLTSKICLTTNLCDLSLKVLTFDVCARRKKTWTCDSSKIELSASRKSFTKKFHYGRKPICWRHLFNDQWKNDRLLCALLSSILWSVLFIQSVPLGFKYKNSVEANHVALCNS